MMHKIFIDGQVGTTGLQIHQRLQHRTDICLLNIADEDRKNREAKRQTMEEADLVILCLPDEAAIESVEIASSTKTRFIDASTAHRTNDAWVYGLPEMNDQQRSRIKSAQNVSNPGCYATGFLLPIIPLIEQEWLKPSTLISCSALSGFSGGGRKLIETYERQAGDNPADLWHSRPYSLGLTHKHIPEMQHYANLDTAPLFLPSVGHFAQGMLVSTGLFRESFNRPVDPGQVVELLMSAYGDELCISVYGPNDESQLQDGYLDPQANNGTNRVDIFVSGHEQQILLISRLDNLGKGASGAAIQNLNLMLGRPELEGLSH
ncbi:MAG: N-acetyl-gamma-glutamyl-phosphate reductase [Gammaproteobacteria bacterium]|nr:N-acetyl-gamma-glutamyl-phosphate reductase [Gammaproteobacteria bacterium]|tara:strand:- start:3908 stop:4864 length:957 start_codon:yes stop_codon:yes gene_type:complete